MKALGYARISKDEEGSVSLDYQKAEIEKLCEVRGLRLLRIEEDSGISGKFIKNRPGVLRVLRAAEAQEIDVVVTYRSDRMSRDGIESLQIEKLFLRQGVEYLSVTEGCLTSESVDGEFMRFLRAGLTERERRLVAMRTRQALQRKRERNERIGGRPCYGLRVVSGELVPEPREQEAIARMRVLHGKGYSSREIFRALEEEGYRTRKGTLFTQTQVMRILRAA